MEINFQNLPEEVVHRMRDGEGNVRKKTFEDDAARIMILTLEPGASIGPHTHDTNFEVFYGVSGRGKVLIGDALDTADPMYPGMCHYCPQGSRHSLVNDGDEPLSVFALVAKHIDE